MKKHGIISSKIDADWETIDLCMPKNRKESLMSNRLMSKFFKIEAIKELWN